MKQIVSLFAVMAITTSVFGQKPDSLYKIVDKKVQQINSQVKTHNIEDVYSLLTKSTSTLNDSHELTKIILEKNDSTNLALADVKSSLHRSLVKQDELQATIVTSAEFKQELQSITMFTRNSVFACFVGLVLLALLKLVAREWFADWFIRRKLRKQKQ